MPSTLPGPRPELTLVREDPIASMLSAGELAFVVWRGPPSVDHIRRWHRLALDHAASAHPPVACFDIVLKGTPTFSDEMRRETMRFASDPKVFPRGLAHVVLMDGLAGSAVRAFIGTVILIAKPAAPAKVFGDFDAAAMWMQLKLAPSDWSASEMVSLCRAAAARPPVA